MSVKKFSVARYGMRLGLLVALAGVGAAQAAD